MASAKGLQGLNDGLWPARHCPLTRTGRGCQCHRPRSSTSRRTMSSIELRKMNLLGEAVTPLIVEAEAEGHRFMRRLEDEWNSGANRFQEAGEFLMSADRDGSLIAIGGLNRDPYSSIADVGRLRHVYVSAAWRRLGVGAMLVEYMIGRAAAVFSTLRLRTTSDEAAAFYERLGFQRIDEEAATHLFKLQRPASDGVADDSALKYGRSVVLP
jgi:N-acetylglutamate synthase-like GNAT family acetyltransferase